MKKILRAVLAFVLAAACLCGLALHAAADDGSSNVTVRLGGLKGPTSIGMVKLLDDAENGLAANSYEFTLAGSADELTPKLLKGDLDILAAPVNLGSILYGNSNGAVRMIAVNTLGVIYVVEKGGDSIQGIADLKGRTIYATGKGTAPEAALSYLLSESGLDIRSDVTMAWKSEPAEVVAQLALEENAVAMLPQPYVTVAENQVDGLRTAISLSDEWEKLDNGSLFITAGLFVRNEFAEKHPEALERFLEEYSASTEYVNANVSVAAQLVEKYGIVKAAVAEKAIPYCNIVCITGKVMKSSVDGFLSILYERNPALTGGRLPDDGFYLIYE